MGIDAFGQLQFVTAGLFEGGDHVVVDLEMTGADVVDQLLAEALQFDVTGKGALLGLGGHEPGQPLYSTSNACLASSQSSITARCLPANARGLFQFS